MSFLDHLDELRLRIMYALIALVIGAAVSYALFEPIISFMKWPLPADMKTAQLTVFGFMQVFMLRFKLSIICGFIFASPFIIYQILAFLAPALKRNERRYIFGMLPILIVLFLGGAAFAFFIVLPQAIQWLQSQGAGQLGFVFKAEDYINFVSMFALGFGVAFETPVVIVFLIKLGIVDRATLRKNWRIAYVASFIIAAIATPDWSIVTMMILGVVLVALFELSMLATRWLQPRDSGQ